MLQLFGEMKAGVVWYVTLQLIYMPRKICHPLVALKNFSKLLDRKTPFSIYKLLRCKALDGKVATSFENQSVCFELCPSRCFRHAFTLFVLNSGGLDMLCLSSIFAELPCLHVFTCFHYTASLFWWFSLVFAENSIADLPSSVCNLIHLKSLCLDNNNVKQVST